MPTDLAFRLGARHAIFAASRGRTRRRLVGRPTRCSHYYDGQAAGADPFNWIRIHPLLPTGPACLPLRPCGRGRDRADAGPCARNGGDSPAWPRTRSWYTETAPQGDGGAGRDGGGDRPGASAQVLGLADSRLTGDPSSVHKYPAWVHRAAEPRCHVQITPLRRMKQP